MFLALPVLVAVLYLGLGAVLYQAFCKADLLPRSPRVLLAMLVFWWLALLAFSPILLSAAYCRWVERKRR